MRHDIFDALELIRARPGMYLGWSPDERSLQLRTLEVLLSGYELAVSLHEINEPGVGFGQKFADFVHKKTGWSVALGAVEAVLDHRSGEDAWTTLWELIDEYRFSCQK